MFNGDNLDKIINYITIKKTEPPIRRENNNKSQNINIDKIHNKEERHNSNTPLNNIKISDKNQNDNPNDIIKKGLSLILEGAQMKNTSIEEFEKFQCQQINKHNAFAGLFNKVSNVNKQEIIGNTIYQTTKKQELDAIIKSIDLSKRCSIIFDENECKKFVDENKKIILCTAYSLFKKNVATKLRGYNVKVKKINHGWNSDLSDRKTGINLNNNNLNIPQSEITLEEIQNKNESKTFFIEGVKHSDLVTNFALDESTSTSKRIQTEKLKDNMLPPEKRRRLDVTTAKPSFIFTQLVRVDNKKPLYRKNQTFWQFHQLQPIEVVGWEEPKPIPGLNVMIDPITDRFYLPHSFQNMAKLLLVFFRGYLLRYTKKGKTRYQKRKQHVGDIVDDMRVLHPHKDMPTEYKHLITLLDNCLMTLLSIHTDVLSESSTDIYRQKFRRYCIYSFCMYLINSTFHNQSVSPLPYNYFNLYSYMYAHGPNIRTTSFLNTLCFLNNNIFKLYRGPVTESVQRLVDTDYTLLKGGKSVTHTFGSPSKTSIHTRTLVSFMMYSEYMIRVLCELLHKIQQLTYREKYNIIIDKIKQNLSRICESVLFVFFSFVFFHRVSTIRQLTNWSALRLILGQPHIHDSKSKARSNKNNTNNEKNKFIKTIKIENSSGLFFSHAHVLGLPFGIQIRLGVPLETINPFLVSVKNEESISLGLMSEINDTCYINTNNNTCIMCGIDIPLPPPPPKGCCSKLVMFDNIFSEQLNEYYNNESMINDLTNKIAINMNNNSWSKMSLFDNKTTPSYCADYLYMRPNVSVSDLDQYKLMNDTLDYLKASPMKDVFIISNLSGVTRLISLGDLALLALWVKIYTLHEAWEKPVDKSVYSSNCLSSIINDKAVSVSENWLSGLCRQLIRIDLVNFGIWGDVKIDLKLDMLTNTMHRNNANLPKQRDKKKYTHIILNSRKNLAELHCKKNIKTKTHLGRVTAASWVVCAIKKISNGDSDIFLKLLEDVGIYHLSHTNPANTFVYFSDNCLSNEDQMGLSGYINRMKEANGQLVLHDGAKKEMTRGTFRTTNKYNSKLVKEKATVSLIKMAIKYWAANNKQNNVEIQHIQNNNDNNINNNINSTKLLWSWPYSIDMCLAGKRISLVCKKTKFLNYCMSDSMISYKYENPKSSFHLNYKIVDEKEDNVIQASSSLSNNDNNNKQDTHPGDIMSNITVCDLSNALSSSAVVTANKNIYKFDKSQLVSSQKDKENLDKCIMYSKIASGIRKICSNKKINNKNLSLDDNIISNVEKNLTFLVHN
nr:MAG: wsv433-like protein [Metapenaeopsis lamellata majanivirus]